MGLNILIIVAFVILFFLFIANIVKMYMDDYELTQENERYRRIIQKQFMDYEVLFSDDFKKVITDDEGYPYFVVPILFNEKSKSILENITDLDQVTECLELGLEEYNRRMKAREAREAEERRLHTGLAERSPQFSMRDGYVKNTRCSK